MIDARTFERLNGPGCPGMFARDAHRVYDHLFRPIENADPKTFTPLAGLEPGECLDIGRDAGHVFWNGRVLNGADVSTFTLLARGFAYDKNRVYRFGELLTPPYPPAYLVLRRREATRKAVATKPR